MSRMRLPTDVLHAFAVESNAIESITDVGRAYVHARALETLLDTETLTVQNVCDFVSQIQPGERLRSLHGMNVYIGNHVPPHGGPEVAEKLAEIVEDANGWRPSWVTKSPWSIHCEYEKLHPFTDGNGRSGRALWLWVMLRSFGPDAFSTDMLFLRRFYYQTLSVYDRLTFSPVPAADRPSAS